MLTKQSPTDLGLLFGVVNCLVVFPAILFNPSNSLLIILSSNFTPIYVDFWTTQLLLSKIVVRFHAVGPGVILAPTPMLRLRSTLLGDISPSIPSTPAQATTWYTLSNVYLQQGLHRRDIKTPGRLIQRAVTFNTTNQHRSFIGRHFPSPRHATTDMLLPVIHSGFRYAQNRRLFEARMIFKHKTFHPGGLNTDFALL